METGSIVTQEIVTGPGYWPPEYAAPELRATPGRGALTTRVIQHSPTARTVIYRNPLPPQY